jgi:hypothetical protein
MMQSTWHLLLAIGHVGLVAGVVVGESRGRSWPAPPLTLGAGMVLSVAALYASEIEVVTEQGIITTSEPFIGIYALGLAIVSFILGLLMTLQWFAGD